MSKKKSAGSLISELKRKTRRSYSIEKAFKNIVILNREKTGADYFEK